MTVVARTRDELLEARRSLPAPVAVVMTMGALHDGHARLVEVAREQARSVVVTIFVNPLQFGAGEDFERYPRTLDADLAVCREHGVDLVFAPDRQSVYPRPALVRVSAGALGDRLEGASRPGHFDGVLTVVAKLLHLTAPDIAVFGEKDAQQLALVRRMVDDLDFPVRVVGVPTVREDDGLARSSRNRYLDPHGRLQARRLSQALRAGAAAGPEGAGAVLAAARAALDGRPGPDASTALAVDYVALVDESTFDAVDPAGPAAGPARLLVAARVGSTRLIDNAPVVLGTPTQR